jgi:autoinducer 2-degrading protein
MSAAAITATKESVKTSLRKKTVMIVLFLSGQCYHLFPGLHEEAAVLTFLSRMTVKAEKEAEFLELVRSLTAAVHAYEPNTLQYRFYKLRDQELGYAVFESFTDEEAEKAHLDTPHFHRYAPPMIECLDGEYVREYLDDLPE